MNQPERTSGDGIYLQTGPTELIPLSWWSFQPERALARLLEDGVINVQWEKNIGGPPAQTVLRVRAKDIFHPSGERLVDIRSQDELELLTNMHLENPRWGAVRWCCTTTRTRPGRETENQMREEGAWDRTMEELPEG